MSNFQAAAAMAVQAQMSRGKNQVGTVSNATQMQQIQQITAPAVGALAPLVMPVPDYENANTLKQALEAINTFGNFAQQRGFFLAGVKNDQEKQQAQLGANALNKFKVDQANDILIGFDATEANKNPGAWASNKTAPYLEGITDQSVRQNVTADIQMGLARQFASSKVDARQLENEKVIEDNRKTNLTTKKFQTDFALEQNSSNWNDTLKSASQSPQAFIESRTTAILSSLKNQGVTTPNAIEDAKNYVVNQLSSAIEQSVKLRKAESENESLQAVVTSFETTDLSVDEMSQYTNKPKEFIINKVLPAIVQNAAVNNKPETLVKVLASMSPEDRSYYENSLTLEYQTAAVSANNARNNSIAVNIQDQLKQSNSLSDFMDGMGGVGVPNNQIIDSGIQYLNAPGSTRQTMAQMLPYVSAMSEQQLNEFDSISKNIVRKSEVEEIDQLISATIKGIISPQLAAENLVYRHSIFNEQAPIWNQKTGALSIDAYEKGMAALKGSFDLITAHQDLNDIKSGKKELSSANLNKAGLAPTNYVEVAEIALQRNAILPSESTTALFADLSKGSGPEYDDALAVLARLATSNIEIDVSSNQADSSNIISAQKTILGLRDKIKFNKDGNLDQGSKKMLTMALSASANSAGNYSSPDAHMEAMAKQNTIYSDRSNLQKNIEEKLTMVMGYAQDGPGIWGWDSTVTDSAGKFFGDRATSDQMRDEVFAETMKEIASGNRVIATTEYTAIAEKALRKVAGQYNAIQYGGTTYGIMKSSYLDARGFDVNNLNSSIEKELKTANVSASDIREIMPIGFDENNHILISVITTQGKYRLFSLPDQKRAEVVNQKSIFEQKIKQSNANYIKNTDREIQNRAGKQ